MKFLSKARVSFFGITKSQFLTPRFISSASLYIGSEQSGNRPAVVLQNDVGNFYSPTLIVATLTSKAAKKVYPADPLPAGERVSLRTIHRSGRADLYRRQAQGAEIPRTPHPGGNGPSG